MREANNWGLRALGYQQFAAGAIDSSTALTVPAGTQVAIFKCAAQAIRFRDDGTAPTTSVGYPLATGVEYVYASASISSLRVIAQVAGAVLDVLYYG